MSSKIKVGILCGGKSSEHEISCISAAGILSAIDRDRFDPVVIGITKSGKWVLIEDVASLQMKDGVLPVIDETLPAIDADLHGLKDHHGHSLDIDVIFPLLHGPYGEDGTVQGMCEMAGIRYVGSGVLASAVAMDKSFAKPIFEAAGLKVAKGVVLNQGSWQPADVSGLHYPLFVKPARGGSSRGTTKVKRSEDLSAALEIAFQYENKVMVEEGLVGREIECGVLERGGEVKASPIGEIIISPDHEFYDFEAKYLDGATDVAFPEDIPANIQAKFGEAAIKAFNALGCEGLARADFFYTSDGEIVINELNTMPGFTMTSMFTRLWERAGMSYSEVISELIAAALERSAHVTR